MKSIIILSAAILIVLAACNNREEEKPNEEQNNTAKKEVLKLSKLAVSDIKLEIIQVAEGELSGSIIAPAEIVPDQDLEAFIGSLVQGRVSKVFVNLGDYVKKGQTLMLIEGLQIGEIKAQFLKSKANLTYTEANYNRLKTLIEQNVGSQKSYLEAKAEYEKAKAEFNAEDKKIHSIGLIDKDIDDSNSNEHIAGQLAIKSPIDGTVVERNVAIGQLIEPNTNSFRILNINSLFADGQIYENDRNRIVGKPDITITSEIYPNTEFKGKLVYLSDVLDKETRTFKVRVSISNQERKLKPDMFAEMHIPTAKSINGIIVPLEAIVRDGDENYVFLAINDTTFEKRTVIVGSSDKEYIEIKSGINIGDRIVSKGTFNLKSELKKEIFGEGD